MPVDEAFPKVPIRLSVLSFPFRLGFRLARYPEPMGNVLGIVTPPLCAFNEESRFQEATAQIGSVTLIQRFGSALNLIQ